MPLYMTSLLLPASPGVPYLIEDKFIRGGYRCVATLTERNAIRTTERKAGMRVFVAENSKTYTLNPGALTLWVEASSAPARQSLNFTAPSALANNDQVDFTLATGKAAYVYDLTLSDAGIEVQCHSTPDRTDTNPYTFISFAGHLSDDGSSKLDNDTIEFNRRYSLVCNREATPGLNTYWRIINKSGASLTPTLDITFLTVE